MTTTTAHHRGKEQRRNADPHRRHDRRHRPRPCDHPGHRPAGPVPRGRPDPRTARNTARSRANRHRTEADPVPGRSGPVPRLTAIRGLGARIARRFRRAGQEGSRADGDRRRPRGSPPRGPHRLGLSRAPVRGQGGTAPSGWPTNCATWCRNGCAYRWNAGPRVDRPRRGSVRQPVGGGSTGGGKDSSPGHLGSVRPRWSTAGLPGRRSALGVRRG